MKKFFISILASLVALSSLLMMPISASAAADTCAWTGATSNLWSVGTNWSGCDNGGVPQTGDKLVFPSGASNQNMNNDLSIVIDDITVNGSGYTFGGNTIELSSDLNIFATTTFSSLVRFSASTGYGQLNIQGASPIFTSGIDLNITGAAFFTVFTSSVSLDLPFFTGSTTSFDLNGNPTAPIELYNSSTTPSTFTAPGGVYFTRASFNCRTNNCLGVDTNTVNIGGADTAGQYLDLNSSGLVFANPIVFNNSGLTGPSEIHVSQDATISGGVSLQTNSNIVVSPSTSLLLNSPGVNLGSSTLTYTVGSGGQITHNGVVSGTGNIIVDGYVQMINANSYTGSTTVNSGGILIISNASGLGTTAGSTTVNGGGTLQFNPFGGPISVAEDITVSGTGRSGSSGALEEYNASNDVTLTGNIVLTGDTKIGQGLAGTGNFRLNGVVSGTGDITVSGFNNSSFTFGGTSANTYSGTLTVTGGQLYLSKTANVTAITGDASAIASPSGNATIYVSNANQIADSSNVVLDTNTGLGSLVLNNDEQIATVTGDGYISFSANTNLTTSSSSNYTFSGNMQKSSAGIDPQFIKAGTGTATLEGTLNASAIGYPQFVVNSGKLLTNVDFTSADYVANNTGTIGGSGKTGATTINSGAVFSPGNSPGCIGTASLNLTSGANFDEELAGPTACTEYDQTTVTGAANLNNANLNIIPSFTPANGQVFTIIQAGSIVGTFNGLADNSQITINGLVFRVNYSGTTVTLTYIAGTLAPTGQNSNQTAAIAFAILGLALAGLGIEYISRRRNV